MFKAQFLKIFPPPKYLAMPYAGLDISDDALTFIQYDQGIHGRRISKFGKIDLPKGLIIGGDVQDEKSFSEILSKFVKENNISRAKVSLPEEKVYLFHTDVPNTSTRSIASHIEFKLEENVPLSAKDALFYYDLVSPSSEEKTLRASVSVIPLVYIEKMMMLLGGAGIHLIGFDIVPRAIVKASLDLHAGVTSLIVHGMKDKIGLYITFGGMVYFTSTFTVSENDIKENLSSEISRVLTYWFHREDIPAPISHIVISGHNAEIMRDMMGTIVNEEMPPRIIADPWSNAFNVNKYIPPIQKTEAMSYIVASGLALP
jgi:Tfp pilus assembly PilM family ATPase